MILEIVITRDGTVGDVSVRRGLGGGLDQRAIEAVRQWKFAPARRLGAPVDVIVEVAVEFECADHADNHPALTRCRRGVRILRVANASPRAPAFERACRLLAEAIDEGALLPLRAFETAHSTIRAVDEFHSEGTEFRREEPVPGTILTFEAMDQTSIRRRLLSVVIGACVVVAGVVMIAMMSDRYEPPLARTVSPHAESLELLVARCITRRIDARCHRCVRSRPRNP